MSRGRREVRERCWSTQRDKRSEIPRSNSKVSTLTADKVVIAYG